MPTWPLDPGTPGINIQGSNPGDDQLDAYGRDILFTDDLQVTPGGDYATIDGFENLRRAILRRLLVSPNEYKLNPQYGVGVQRYVKKLQTKANLDALKHAIVDNLSRERRLDKILKVGVAETFFGDEPGIVVTVHALALGRDLRFKPFGFTQKGTF